MNGMDLLAAMRVFVRVMETHSFSGVARELGTTQPTISKQIGWLEQQAGARLLHRTTRSVTPTGDGLIYYDHCRTALVAVEAAQTAVGKRRISPAGLVRIGSPVAFGRLHLAPRIGVLLDRYPDLAVELVMNDRFVDLVEQGIDLAVRVGELADTRSLVARRIGTTARVTVGSTEYFERHGEPRTPEDLTSHNCIVYTELSTRDAWHFVDKASRLVQVRVSGNFLANNSEAVREAVIAGVGIGTLPTWHFRDEISGGKVRIVLREWKPKRLPIHAIWPSRRQLPAKIRAVADFLAEEFRRDPVFTARHTS